jgi:aminopeptidase YwaD
MRVFVAFSLLVAVAVPLHAQSALPLLSAEATHALAQETSGDVAMRNLEEIVRHHRMRGSRGYRAAAEQIAGQLRAYGLTGVEILSFPADGEIYYGTQRSRPAWNAEQAELWEIRPDGDRLIASWETMPMRLAQDSESGSATASVVDVGPGTSAADYAGRDVRGKLVLTSSQPGAIAPLAFGQHGAAGILSYAQNQRTGWWGENERLVRWGHLDTFSDHPGFAFMLSLQEARGLQARLGAGEDVRMRAVVRAGKSDGAYEIVTATIPGATAEQEIVYSCHLDHPRPGANDNASGCAAILEVARTLSRLVAAEKLPRPARTIRFVWPPEIEGTMALLVARPELTARMKAAVHLDMVGGGAETKAMFHVTRGPATLPSFIYDLSQEMGRWVSEQTATFAMSGAAEYPLLAASGTKDPLRAELVDFTIGSDHQIYSEASFGIPAIYLNDWPDRYIHTHLDVSAHIDPTKLGRAALIAAASGWALANLSAADVPEVLAIHRRNALRRSASLLERRAGVERAEGEHLTRFHAEYERALIDSIERFVPLPVEARRQAGSFLEQLGRINGAAALGPAAPAAGAGGVVYRRNAALKGPMSVFGYDYFTARYGAERVAALALMRMRGDGRRGAGGEYAYEGLNLVDGQRTVAGIRNSLTAIYGPVSLEAVSEYLEALESIGVIERIPR